MVNMSVSDQARLNAKLAVKDMEQNLALRGVKAEPEKKK